MRLFLAFSVAMSVVFSAAAEEFPGRKTIPAKEGKGGQPVKARQVSTSAATTEGSVVGVETEEEEAPPEVSKSVLEAKRRANLRAPRPFTSKPGKSDVVIPSMRRPSYLPDLQSLGKFVPIAYSPIFGESFLAGTVGSKPPDSAIAVGPVNVITATNSGIQIFKKNGTTVKWKFSGHVAHNVGSRPRIWGSWGRRCSCSTPKRHGTLTSTASGFWPSTSTRARRRARLH